MNPRVAVIGAGVAGLFAAAACRRAGLDVVLLDRDRLDETGLRPGVPQGPQPHVYLLRGLIAAERLLPGLRPELLRAGAVPFDTARLAWLAESGWYPTDGRAFEVLSMTRPLFESVVRRKVLDLGGIDLRGECRVKALARSEPGQDGHWRVRCDDARSVAADLVVDASGRGTRILSWLDALGVTGPAVTHIDAKVGYATRMFTAAPDLGRLAGIVMQAHPGRPTGAAVLPVEDGRWLVGLGGYGEHRPPRDEEGFNAFAGALADPCVADFIAAAQPCTAVAIHRQTENRYHHFERIRDWPDRLVAIGDAFVSFNPIYGQGITVAAGQAEILNRDLGAGPARLDTRRLMRRFATVAGLPWAIATGQDLRQPSCTGRPSRAQTASTAWSLTVQRLAVHGNLRALGALNQLYHLTGSPAVMLHPALLAAAARARLGGRAPSAPRPFDLPSSPVA